MIPRLSLMIKEKPVGKLSFIECVPYSSGSITSGAKLVYKDDEGKLWVFHAVAFNFELEPYSERQTLKFVDWREEIKRSLVNGLPSDATYSWLLSRYRLGMSSFEVLTEINSKKDDSST